MPYKNPKPELKGSSGSETYGISKEEYESYQSFTQKYIQIGHDQAEEEYRELLEEKDRIIAEQKRQLAERKVASPPEQRFCYNRALFPKDNGEEVITALINLTYRKCGKNKYVISTKTDWYIVWMVLHYHALFIGNCYDFLEIINDCVLENMENDKRDISKITPQQSNFSFKKGNPIKEIGVFHWTKKLYEEQQKRTDDPKLRGTSVLERAVSIRRELETMLKHQGIESLNYE